MADRTIGSLPQAATVDDASLFVIEQQGDAMSCTGAQWKGYAQAVVQQYVTQAQGYAEDASDSADAAAQSATDASASATDAAKSAASAAESADTAQQYSGKPPIIQNDTWWTWNAETQQYEDTGENARGDVMYATFEIDPDTGILTMTTPALYDGPTFEIVDGYLEVSINA